MHVKVEFFAFFLQIIPEPVLKNPQLVSGEISEDMASAKEELDQAVPFHQLLDVSANKAKAELAHKGILSQRQRPSQEALRATVLRKSVSTVSSASDSGLPVGLLSTLSSGIDNQTFYFVCRLIVLKTRGKTLLIAIAAMSDPWLP